MNSSSDAFLQRQYQRTDSVNYLVEAAYNRAGSVTSETYPSVPGAGDRRTVSYTMDTAGRLASLSSSATTYAPSASVSSIGYAAHNAPSTETYGNSLIHAVTYNTRLQPNEIKLGTSGSPTSVLSLNYNYGTTNNNGNVQGVSYSGGGLSYTQNFTYDSLNRLSTAQEGSSWSQTNAYDRYGNRQISYGGGVYNLTFSSTTNRITTSGYTYDLAGNLTNDTIHSYTFDAENKIKTVDINTAYTYDGEGQRVRKVVYQGENTRFIYGISGQLLAEFSGSTGNLTKEYIQAGGTLITIEPTAVNSNGTRYTTSDHLGSPRVVTNSSASVVSRHDFMPFGEEIGLIGGRTTGMGYSVADGLRQKFTSKERDNETGLDYFLARYYSATQGRFTSVDPLGASANVGSPQSFNRYSYVKNNPTNFVDPQGLEAQEPKPKRLEDLPPPPPPPILKPSSDIPKVVVNANDTKILDVQLNLFNPIKTEGGDKRLPVGGEFEIVYIFVTSAPTDGQDPGELGRIEPVTTRRDVGENTATGTLDGDSQVTRVGTPRVDAVTDKEAVTVTKVERFKINNDKSRPRGGTFEINYVVAVTSPTTGQTVRASTQDQKSILSTKRIPKPVPVWNVLRR